MSDQGKSIPVLFLDIDGTVREGKDDALGRFVNGPEDVRVFPEAVAAIRQWKEAGGRVVGISNQGGIALGIVTAEKVNAAMDETMKQCNGLIDRIFICPHHPQAPDLAEARCFCRKPAPGLVVMASLYYYHQFGEHCPMHLGLMVGDRPEDRECASLAGLSFMWAKDWRSPPPPPDYVNPFWQGVIVP
jgi:D-glycero-D-manno-heptose 1,7-bisphosphate phosphatase